ncbi:MAG: hydrogenase nickel incorporation protein HypB [Candidatus Bathyarchaeia archaeon]
MRPMVMQLKEIVEAEEGEVFDIELEADILEANRKLAEKNRGLLQKYDVRAIDVMGATGAGKTSLIEKMVQALIGKYRIAAFKGDLTTTIDAERIERHGAEAVPITTGKECHLDANLVGKALARINLDEIDLLFIENVGNLICPAEFPLGADRRIVVVSVTEGPYMIIKHPFIFMDADVVVINKMDLADAMGVDVKKLEGDVKRINPKAAVAVTNCRSGEGVTKVIEVLQL